MAVGWLCVRAATVDALVRRNPAAVVAVSPGDPRVAFAFADLEFRTGKGEVRPGVSSRAVNALQRAPLAHEPFFFASLDRLVRGDSKRAFAAIKEARRRNPRYRLARLIYLDQVLRTGQVEEAAIEIAVISRLIPETSKVLVPELAKYATDPQTAPALVKALRRDPSLRDAVLEHLAAKGADPEDIMRLAAAGPSAPETRGAPVWQGALLTSLVEKGDIGRARELWSQIARIDRASLPYGIYDASFSGKPGPAPFNWTFAESAAGVAEPTKAPALQIEYYGRVEAELASQLLQLDAGPHILSLQAAGNAPSGKGSVAWTLTCAGGKANLGTMPITDIAYSPKRLTLAFSVPAGCPAQWLRLAGTPAEFPAAHSITMSGLQIRRAGR